MAAVATATPATAMAEITFTALCDFGAARYRNAIRRASIGGYCFSRLSMFSR